MGWVEEWISNGVDELGKKVDRVWLGRVEGWIGNGVGGLGGDGGGDEWRG